MTSIFMLLFERMHALHGFENTLTGLKRYLERERMEMLADRILEFDPGDHRQYCPPFPGPDPGFNFTDDWGTQQALIIRPSLWRDFFQPRYTRLFSAMHAAGWHVWMHSCGKVNAILENLLEAGVNVVNLQQPRALDICAVGRQFRGRLCFKSLCDIQHTLPFQSPSHDRSRSPLAASGMGCTPGRFCPVRLRRWASHRRNLPPRHQKNHARSLSPGRPLESPLTSLHREPPNPLLTYRQRIAALAKAKLEF